MSGAVVLVVDADAAHEAETLSALVASGVPHTAVVMHDGMAALDYLLDHCGQPGGPALPAVVLLSLRLPRLDGIEVLRQIRGDRRTEVLPVVVLTSSREDSDVVHSYMIGANGFVRNHRDPEQRVLSIANFARYWLGTNIAPPRRS